MPWGGWGVSILWPMVCVYFPPMFIYILSPYISEFPPWQGHGFLVGEGCTGKIWIMLPPQRHVSLYHPMERGNQGQILATTNMLIYIRTTFQTLNKYIFLQVYLSSHYYLCECKNLC